MEHPHHQVPPMGPEMQGAGPVREEQRQQVEQGEGDPALSLTLSGTALHHTGTGAARCYTAEGSVAVEPLKGLPGTHEGPARQAQQAGGARDPASQQYMSRSHQGLHWD